MAPPTTTEASHTTLRRALMLFAIIGVVLLSATAPVAAQESCDGKEDCTTKLENKFNELANFMMVLVAAAAVPNGAYGFLQWMTANDSVEKDDKGRRRIRNTFIALGGVGLLKILVEVIKAILF